MEKLISEIVEENLSFFYNSCTQETKIYIAQCVFYEVYFKRKKFIISLDNSISQESLVVLLKKYKSKEIVFLKHLLNKNFN